MEEQLKKMNSKLIKARKLINAINKDMKVIIGDDKINPEIEDLAGDFAKFRLDSFEKITSEGFDGSISDETVKKADLLLRRFNNATELELDDEHEIMVADNLTAKAEKLLGCLKECDKLSREHQEMLITILKLSEKLDINADRKENVSNIEAIIIKMDEFIALG